MKLSVASDTMCVKMALRSSTFRDTPPFLPTQVAARGLKLRFTRLIFPSTGAHLDKLDYDLNERLGLIFEAKKPLLFIM
jgi:hypothetical protein